MAQLSRFSSARSLLFDDFEMMVLTVFDEPCDSALDFVFVKQTGLPQLARNFDTDRMLAHFEDLFLDRGLARFCIEKRQHRRDLRHLGQGHDGADDDKGLRGGDLVHLDARTLNAAIQMSDAVLQGCNIGLGCNVGQVGTLQNGNETLRLLLRIPLLL